VPNVGRSLRITLDASLVTGIDPPPEVESALAAINPAHNSAFTISAAASTAAVKISLRTSSGRASSASFNSSRPSIFTSAFYTDNYQ
jgi:hypothetical protein